MDINKETKQGEITLHVYIDDLQEVIQKNRSPELFLATANEIDSADHFIFQYISEHLIMKNESRAIPLKWVGKEQSEDLFAYWIYLKTEQIDESKTITVSYNLLQDLYADQQNILNITNSVGESSYFLCRKGDDLATLN